MTRSSLPDPSGRPRPAGVDLVGVVETVAAAVAKGLAVVVSGGIFLVLIGSVSSLTRGATRSARLRWEERQRQAQDAVERALAAERIAETARHGLSDGPGER